MSCCGSSKKDTAKDSMKHLSPLDQLKLRLVNGEIDMEEYIQTKEVIEQP